MMKKYVIGGWVRDVLMQRQPNDKDFVVVGATCDEMKNLGFIQVGKSFPVFLHPQTKEEYALARRERKIGNGHADFEFDFAPDISLKEDCLRRDFTCNAIAKDEETGEIIDYFDGRKDIENKIIRIIDENNFRQDPLRILRACRFAATLDFEIEEQSKVVLRQMVAEGMLKHLSAERVWAETLKALQKGANSVKFFSILAEIGGLDDWWPEVRALVVALEQKKYHYSQNSFWHTMYALDRVRDDDAMVKWAVVCHDLGKGNTPADILPRHSNHEVRGVKLIDVLCGRLRVPNEYRNFARLFCEEHLRVARFCEMRLAKQYDFVGKISSGFKCRDRLEMFLRCFWADYYGEQVLSDYCDDEKFEKICQNIRNIFDIMNGVKLKDLSEKRQKALKNLDGVEFGKLYRDYMVEYLRERL